MKLSKEKFSNPQGWINDRTLLVRQPSAFLFIFSALGAFESIAEELPIGLDAEFNSFSATVESSEIFDPNREKPHVLIVSSQLNPEFESDSFLISSVKFSADEKFPPKGSFYRKKSDYLWRWIQALGPDAVVSDNSSLREALKGKIPAFHSTEDLPENLTASPARLELQKRSNRTPLEIADAIANHYGQKLNQISYIPALAMIGRGRLAELKGNSIEAELKKIANAAPNPKKLSGPGVAGNLIFADLEMRDRTIAAAEMGIRSPGDNQMSDSVFMICPMLAEAGNLSGDAKFHEACLAHFQKMKSLCLRADGLYRHSPMDEAAWGRGNGFPALGLAWTISSLPESTVGRKALIEEITAHLSALLPHQDQSGMWHQVIDRPGSYREFTCTCMITYAMLRGMREGWLPRDKFESAAEKGWNAVKQRISLDGKFFTDACTGTGKQKSLQDYFLRTAILGPDDRSGAMALLVSTERAQWERENQGD